MMRAFRWTVIGASALALAACGGGRKDDNAANVAAASTVNETEMAAPPAAEAPGQAFANTAAASDAFEIETSRLAEAQAKSPAVKKFAASMVTAHTESTEKLKATAAPVIPDPTLTAEQQQMLDTLKPLNGDAFDKAYATAQVDAHQKTLDALKAYSADGDVPAMKSFATTLVPTVTAHLNMAKSLAR